MPPIKFHDNPRAEAPEIQQELKRVVAQIVGPETIKGVRIVGGFDTPVAHGQRWTPRTFTFTPYAQVAWNRAGAPDARCIYIRTASTVVGDIVVYP